MAEALARLSSIARDPAAYIRDWRDRHPGHPVVGVLPMNFPRELALAAGALPVVVQDDGLPVTEGRALLAEFYCGFTRNLVDQAVTGRLDAYDGLFMVDHCISLVGAADVVRAVNPATPVFFGMLMASMGDASAARKVVEMMGTLRTELQRFTATTIDDDAVRAAVRANNRDRALLRCAFDARRSGDAALRPAQLQDLVTTSMVMDPDEHHALLVEALAEARAESRDDRVRVHLSGHLCHAPRRELLDLVEESGALVVDDDLYHGRRHVSTDVAESGDPIEALAGWYAQRNTAIPCPTRVQRDADWDRWLVDAVHTSGAEAVLHLLPKFCEPHMLYYPELRKGLDAAGIPHLLLETEHEGMPLESFRTRIEALVERARRRRPVPA